MHSKLWCHVQCSASCLVKSVVNAQVLQLAASAISGLLNHWHIIDAMPCQARAQLQAAPLLLAMWPTYLSGRCINRVPTNEQARICVRLLLGILGSVRHHVSEGTKTSCHALSCCSVAPAPHVTRLLHSATSLPRFKLASCCWNAFTMHNLQIDILSTFLPAGA